MAAETPTPMWIRLEHKMSEEEKQEAFREEVRGYLAKDKAVLDSLVGRVDKLEKTVMHGNGTPPLITQFAAMHAQMENFRTELKEVKDKISGLDDMKTDIASIKASMATKEKNSAVWITCGITILAVVVAPIVEHLFFK